MNGTWKEKETSKRWDRKDKPCKAIFEELTKRVVWLDCVSI
jgi:hypothetical protein